MQMTMHHLQLKHCVPMSPADSTIGVDACCCIAVVDAASRMRVVLAADWSMRSIAVAVFAVALTMRDCDCCTTHRRPAVPRVVQRKT